MLDEYRCDIGSRGIKFERQIARLVDRGRRRRRRRRRR
jgi:hypothetical protein